MDDCYDMLRNSEVIEELCELSESMIGIVYE